MIVNTTNGPVRGGSTETGHVFRSIPYAAGPRGTERFQAPAPHPGWTAVRDATRHGPTAPQPDRSRFGGLDMTPYFGPGWVRGDEYLTIDVHTPRDTSVPVPVMAFVHGGGFLGGSTQASLYEGSTFARDGIMYVGINYRLGAAGFMKLDDAPNNRGMLDVVAALRWIQGNAARFGGDPNNVTVCGQSAGAILVGALLADPTAVGLFHRAILQSGSGSGAFSPDQATVVSDALSSRLGRNATALDLAKVNDEQLVEAVSALGALDLQTPDAFDPLGGITPFSVVLSEQPWIAISAGRGPQVDLLIGANTEEAALYLAPVGRLQHVDRQDVLAAAARFHRHPKELVEAYAADLPSANDAELLTAVLGDGMFGIGTERMARAHAADPRTKTFRYEFDWRSRALDGRLGSAHTIELPFVFDVANRDHFCGPDSILGPVKASADLGQRTHRSWVDFVKSGDPGWPSVSDSSGLVQRIGDICELRAPTRPTAVRTWIPHDPLRP